MQLGNFSYKIQYLNQSKITDEIKNIELKDRISTIAPKLVEVINIADKQAAVIGVIWSEELKIKNHCITQDGGFPEEDTDGLIGFDTASQLKLKVGDTINIYGKNITIKGVLNKTGSADDKVIFTVLPLLQNISGKTTLLILLK